MSEDWTEDNFGNDGARDYLAMLTAKLVATIREVIVDDERIGPDEDGESLLMPSVEVLALLCERYDAAPPRPTTVRQWHEKYPHDGCQNIGATDFRCPIRDPRSIQRREYLPDSRPRCLPICS